MSSEGQDPQKSGSVQGFHSLRQGDDFFPSLVESFPYAVVVINGVGGLEFINEQTEKMFGYDRNELPGRPVEILVPDRFRKEHAEHRARYISQPRMRPMGGNLELLGRRKDGSEFPVEISLSPLKKGDGTLVAAIIRDITGRKRAEEALTDARAFSENLLQTANVMIVMLDERGCVTRLNQTAEKMTGYTQAELHGKNWFEVLVPKDRFPFVWEEFKRLMSGGLPRTFENPILTRSGEERYILWQNNELKAGGRITGTISFGNDMTEHKRAEEALRESERRLRDLTQNSL